MEPIFQRYDVEIVDVDVGLPDPIRLAQVRDINALVDAIDPEEFAREERLPYWASLWPAARTLARYLARGVMKEGEVLELGAGLGLPSLVSARLGHQTTASDYEPDALEFVRENAALNGLTLTTRNFSFYEPERIRFEHVIGADLLYEARLAKPLARSIALTLAPGGRAWIADPRRPHLTTFVHALREEGLLSAEVHQDNQSVVLRIEAQDGR